MSLVQVVAQKRGAGIGASLAAACLGCSPYLSPIGAWLQLKGRAKSKGGAPAEWGQILEPVIRGYYAARHGYDKPGQIEVVVPAESLYHPDYPWLQATPDGIVREWMSVAYDEMRGGPQPTHQEFDRHLVECKNVSDRVAWHWGLDRRARSAPPYYRIQAVVQMAVTSLPRTDFAVLFGGNDYDEIIVERDLDLEAMTIDRLAAFRDSLDRDEPPEIDDAAEWRDYFKDRLPTEKVRAQADADVEALLDQWKRQREDIERATKDEATTKNLLLAAAAGARANVIDSDHGPVLVVMPKKGSPYLKAPVSWGLDKES